MDTPGHARPIDAKSDGRFHALIDNLLEACQVIAFDWRYVYMNPSAVRQNRMVSADQAIGKTMMEFYPGIDQTPVFAELRRCMEQRVPTQTITEFTFPDGAIGWFEVRCEPVPEGIFILSIDITERKRAEDELLEAESRLRQSQKMEAIGRLAAGVAHDFNNLLTVISLASDMLLNRSDTAGAARDALLPIKQASERGAALTRQLLAFSRQQVLEPRVIDINAIAAGTEKMLERLIGSHITVALRLAANLDHIKADPGQIEQVIMNLAINARDAMPDGGTLTIETANTTLDAQYAQMHPEVVPGPYVMLAVSDTGAGMDKETQARIFEPFFTTKAQGKGTGLGLSTVFGIVKQSGGSVWVYSEPGHGSCFKIYLPRAEETVVAHAPVESQPALGGNETILLVEDDAAVRAMTSLALQLYGYTVLEAARGRDALRLCETHAGAINLLISDVIMPDMGGRKVVDAIRALRPDIRVLYVSGYTDDAVLRYGVEVREAAFLQKPFTPDSLAQKVREVMQQEPACA